MSLTDLIAALEPVALVKSVASPVPDRVELRLIVRPTTRMGTDDQIRRSLYVRAEEVIATAERRGWEHVIPPHIELTGFVRPNLMTNKPDVLYECEMQLDGWIL